ncbi:MAG UNVERIFIED_CONTAM: hypothetical protein LVR18_33430 [Planctomycetaceae bacterium]
MLRRRRDVWLVMADYFRCYVAKVDVQDLFPPSMSGNLGERVAEGMGRFRFLPFPGGWTIGWLMLLNLISAHVLRFQIRRNLSASGWWARPDHCWSADAHRHRNHWEFPDRCRIRQHVVDRTPNLETDAGSARPHPDWPPLWRAGCLRQCPVTVAGCCCSSEQG